MNFSGAVVLRSLGTSCSSPMGRSLLRPGLPWPESDGQQDASWGALPLWKDGHLFPGVRSIVSAWPRCKLDNNRCLLKDASGICAKRTFIKEEAGFWMALPQSLVPFLSTAVHRTLTEVRARPRFRGGASVSQRWVLFLDDADEDSLVLEACAKSDDN